MSPRPMACHEWRDWAGHQGGHLPLRSAPRVDPPGLQARVDQTQPRPLPGPARFRWHLLVPRPDPDLFPPSKKTLGWLPVLQNAPGTC
jgi:hypothetical protein